MLAIQKHLAIEYRPINLAVIIFVPLSDFYLIQYSNLVLHRQVIHKTSHLQGSTHLFKFHKLLFTLDHSISILINYYTVTAIPNKYIKLTDVHSIFSSSE